MAHKRVESAVRNVKLQQDAQLQEHGTDVSYRAILAWRKDLERWPVELRAAVDTTRYILLEEVEWWTKNQAVIARKR